MMFMPQGWQVRRSALETLAESRGMSPAAGGVGMQALDLPAGRAVRVVWIARNRGRTDDGVEPWREPTVVSVCVDDRDEEPSACAVTMGGRGL